MDKFKFSLQKLLEYKEQLLQTAQGELAKINQQMDYVLTEERTLEDKYRDQQDLVRQSYQQGVTPGLLAMYQNYMDRLQNELRGLVRRKQFLTREQSNQLEKIKAINIEISSLEKLREREEKKHNYGVQKQEEIKIEEFVLSAMSRAQAI